MESQDGICIVIIHFPHFRAAQSCYRLIWSCYVNPCQDISPGAYKSLKSSSAIMVHGWYGYSKKIYKFIYISIILLTVIEVTENPQKCCNNSSTILRSSRKSPFFNSGKSPDSYCRKPLHKKNISILKINDQRISRSGKELPDIRPIVKNTDFSVKITESSHSHIIPSPYHSLMVYWNQSYSFQIWNRILRGHMKNGNSSWSSCSMRIAIWRRLQAKEGHSHCFYSLRWECGKISSIWDYKKPYQVSKSFQHSPCSGEGHDWSQFGYRDLLCSQSLHAGSD